MINSFQCDGSGVDKINPCKLRGAAVRSEGEECAAEDARYAAQDEVGSAVRCEADSVASGEVAGDGDETGGSVGECGIGRGPGEGFDQGCGVCCYHRRLRLRSKSQNGIIH